MRTREFPVLSEEDEPLVGRLAVGVGDDAARVLAYLLRRRTDSPVDDGPADRLALRIGTGLTRSTLSDALGRLEERELVTTTTVKTDQGRPPTAWQADADVDATLARVDATHAGALFEQAVAVATALETPTALDESTLPTAGVEPASDPDPDLDSASTSFAVGLNWFANVLHAPLFAAADEGAYARRGLDVSIESFTGSDHAIEAVASGTVDVAIAGAATVTRARAAGVPVVPLAPLYQRAMTVLYTTTEAFGGRLGGIEDVRGRRVGMPVGAETGILGRLYLSQSGVLDDVTVVDLSGEETDALSTDRADVVSGSIGDVRALEADGHTVDVLSVDDHFPIYGPTLVTTADVVQSHPGVIASFLAGTVSGWRTAEFDPDVAVRAVRSHTESGTPFDRAVAELSDTIGRFGRSGDVTDNGWGWHDTDGWRRLSTALGQVGLLEPADDPGGR